MQKGEEQSKIILQANFKKNNRNDRQDFKLIDFIQRQISKRELQ